jgi:hypothetical protein
MDRQQGRRTTSLTLTNELQQLETDLARLTVQVARLRRHQAGGNAAATTAPTAAENEQVIRIGDHVLFKLGGQYTEGVVISLTAHRVRIRQHRTNHIFLRSPRNVTPHHDGGHEHRHDNTNATGAR